MQVYFLRFLQGRGTPEKLPAHSVMDTISKHHEDYLARTPDIDRDSRYAFSVCCCVARMLAAKPA